MTSDVKRVVAAARRTGEKRKPEVFLLCPVCYRWIPLRKWLCTWYGYSRVTAMPVVAGNGSSLRWKTVDVETFETQGSCVWDHGDPGCGVIEMGYPSLDQFYRVVVHGKGVEILPSSNRFFYDEESAQEAVDKLRHVLRREGVLVDVGTAL